MSGGFGGGNQPAAPAPQPTTPGTAFSFGMGSTSTPAAGGFGTTPATFGFGAAPPQPSALTPTTGAFGMNAAPTPTPGFAGNQMFGAQSTGMGGAVGTFSIGTGSAKSTGGSTGTTRRVIKARRPPK